MKPPFENNQEIICIDGDSWVYDNQFIFSFLGLFGKKHKPTSGPKTKEHCWVLSSYYSEGFWYLRLFGYQGGYRSHNFRAIETQSLSLSEQAKAVIKEPKILISDN